MNKIGIITKREYITRVRKKSFIITTLLSPLLILAIIFSPALLSGIQDMGTKRIAVVDFTGKYAEVFKSSETYFFEIIDQQPDFSDERRKDYYAFIIITTDLLVENAEVTIYSENRVNAAFKAYVSNLLSRHIESKKLAEHEISNLKQIIDDIRAEVKITTITWSSADRGTMLTPEIAMAIGMTLALLIYVFIFLYGSQVMRGVVEEKVNRIVEVIISSVKPYELMFGKIIGIALVGLTQFLVWIFMLILLTNTFATETQTPLLAILSDYNLSTMLIYFLLYFLGGYLLYASLFAVVGALSDNDTDTQQFIIPLTIPIIFAIIAAPLSIENPHSSLAFWTSIIPFTSPIVMMAIIPQGVALWQLILSLSILFFSFLTVTLFAGKIYRTAILMYGKKITYKEIWKWIK